MYIGLRQYNSFTLCREIILYLSNGNNYMNNVSRYWLDFINNSAETDMYSVWGQLMSLNISIWLAI